jgi:hypothetical protein
VKLCIFQPSYSAKYSIKPVLCYCQSIFFASLVKFACNIVIKPVKKIQFPKNKPAIRLSQVRSAIDSYLLLPSEIRSDGKNYILK